MMSVCQLKKIHRYFVSYISAVATKRVLAPHMKLARLLGEVHPSDEPFSFFVRQMTVNPKTSKNDSDTDNKEIRCIYIVQR